MAHSHTLPLPPFTLAFVIGFAGMVMSHTSTGEVYRWVDDNGNVEYSDQYREGAEKIEVQPAATISMPKPEDVFDETVQSGGDEEAGGPLYDQLSFTFPTNDSAFHSGSGDVTVTLALSPALLPSHKLRLSMDGTVVGTSSQPFFKLANVFRGTHQLSVDVVDSTDIVQEGPTIQFTMHRPSVAN